MKAEYLTPMANRSGPMKDQITPSSTDSQQLKNQVQIRSSEKVETVFNEGFYVLLMI